MHAEGNDRNERSDQELLEERTRLAEIAFRMLGSALEADAAVEATLERWSKLTADQRAAIHSPQHWMAESISRLCLHRLTVDPPAQADYPGGWLPESLPLRRRDAPQPGRGSGDHITLDESVNMLLLVVLESLTAEQRVAFILHNVFGIGLSRIADVVGRPPDECFRLARSARRQIQGRRRNEVSGERQRQIMLELLAACGAMDESALRPFLHPRVTLLIDSGGKGGVTTGPVEGVDAASRLLIRMLAAVPTMTMAVQAVNGSPGLVLSQGGRVIGVLSVNVEAGTIINAWLVTNPDKLRTWNSR